MREAVARLWPEIDWIQNTKLRAQVTETWIKALERSPLKPDDLNRIPFTLLVPNCPITLPISWITFLLTTRRSPAF